MNTDDFDSRQRRKRRIAMDFVLAFSVLFLPWWIAVFLIILSALFIQNFYEAFFFGLLLDVFYGTASVNFYGFHLFFTAAALFLIFFSSIIKKKVRFFS